MLKKLAPLALALLAPITAQACEYTAHVYGTGDSSWFREVVTEKFCEKYPFGKYKLVVFNSDFSFSNEGVGTAIAYVSPRLADEGTNRPTTARYTGASRGPKRDLPALVKEASIIAVSNLMDNLAPDVARSRGMTQPKARTPDAVRYEDSPGVVQPEAHAALPLPGQPGYVTTFPEAAKISGSGGAPF